MASISLKGIDHAIENLNYRDNSIKHKVLSFIRHCYSSEQSIETLKSINTDSIVQAVWNTGDNTSKIRTKRRNFSSIKSSINADLKKLSKQNQNPENITITDANIFDMNEDAKNDLLQSFSNAVKTGETDINQIAELLKVVTDFLKESHEVSENNSFKDIVSQVKEIINKISTNMVMEPDFKNHETGDNGETEEIGADKTGLNGTENTEIDEELEEVEIDDDEFEEIGDDVINDELEELKKEVVDEDLEEIEVAENEDLPEEEQEQDGDVETIELDDDEEIEEIDEDEFEEAEFDDNGDLEEIAVEEDENIGEAEPDEELPDANETDENIEIIDDDELEEVEIDDDELDVIEKLRKEKELAKHFDNFLGENEKKYNNYIMVPAGKYTVGSKRNFKDTLQLQQIDMPELYCAQYPVTNSLFEIFVEQTGYVTLAEKKGSGTVFNGRFKRGEKLSIWKSTSGSTIVPGACWYQPQGPGSTIHGKKYHPVVQISVDDAWSFASWIGRRLPTEAEWEACARTDMGLKYPWGNEWKDGCCNTEKSSFADTTPVDKYDNFSNGLNISDLLGNVFEWTSDTESPPFNSSDKLVFNIAKGGGWAVKENITIGSRSLFKPGFTSNLTGFRCVSEKLL